MDFTSTIAYSCRYGDNALNVFGKYDVLWENSESDYQGHAHFFGKKDGAYVAYEWSYGSCSGCDGWEADGSTDEQIEKEMHDSAVWLDNVEQLRTWYEMLQTEFDKRMYRWDSYDEFGRLNAIRKELGMEPLPKKEDNDE